MAYGAGVNTERALNVLDNEEGFGPIHSVTYDSIVHYPNGQHSVILIFSPHDSFCYPGSSAWPPAGDVSINQRGDVIIAVGPAVLLWGHPQASRVRERRAPRLIKKD